MTFEALASACYAVVEEILLRAEYVTHPDGQGQGFFFQQNRLGSITHLTGFSGEPIEMYRYDAFGSPTTIYNAGGAFDHRFKFTGREYQANFGIYEYRARAYHPGLGRFLTEDPIGFAAGDTNMFRYCGGDPVNWSDPFGLYFSGIIRIALQNNGINPTTTGTTNEVVPGMPQGPFNFTPPSSVSGSAGYNPSNGVSGGAGVTMTGSPSFGGAGTTPDASSSGPSTGSDGLGLTTGDNTGSAPDATRGEFRDINIALGLGGLYWNSRTHLLR